jgi:hypothetical protein
MKTLVKLTILIIVALIVTACASTQLVNNWKNPEIESYAPTKVLIVGLSSNLEARTQFETDLATKFIERGTEVVTSLDFFQSNYKLQPLRESDLQMLEDSLLVQGFDTIIFSKVIGVEDKIVYRKDFETDDEMYKKFREDYLRYQDAYYNPQYYDEYTIYHAVTSLYCICPTKDRELIWKGYINITDPTSVNETVTQYINLVIAVLEEQNLIAQKINTETEAIK